MLGCDDIYMDPVIERLFDEGFIFSERREQEIRVTSMELILNSFDHGCKNRGDLFVEFKTYFGEKGILIQVIDDGPGFNHRREIQKRKKTQDKLTPEIVLSFEENNDYPGGSGIYCLLEFADDFQYNKKGNGIMARFDLQS